MVETPRLRLSPLDPEAAAALLVGDRPAAARRTDATLPHDRPQPDLFEVLPSQAAASAETVPYGIWVMIERRSGTVIGDIGFMGPPDGDGAVEVGYSVVPGWRRRGIATEAGSALVAWALAQPGVTAVLAECDTRNVASIRTLERLGFRRTGTDDEVMRWRIP